MPEESEVLGSVRFDRFELSVETGELRKDGARLKLSGQAIQVLVTLAANPGKLVTREELQRKLWPGASYGDPEHGLNAAVNKLRETLGDSATEPRYIETVPGRGYRFIAALEPQGVSPEPEPQPPKPPWWKRKTTIVVAASIAIAAVLYPWIAPPIERLLRLRELQQLRVVPFTALPGNVASPTFSPDGSEVAFAWDGENGGAGFDLYVKTIGAEKPRRITQHPSVRLSAAWSPDGRNIAISRIGRERDSGIYLIPPTGGPERKLISKSNTTWYGYEISWSPDGRNLAFIQHPDESPSDITLGLYVLSLETLKATRVETGCLDDEVPSYSPRRTLLGWVCAGLLSSSLRVLDLRSGNISQLLERKEGIDGIAWSGDGRRLVLSSVGDLWELYPDSHASPHKLPVGHDATDVAVSSANNRIVYVQGTTNVNIWRIDLMATPPKPSKLVISSRRQVFPSISPDGSKIAFESDRSGPNEIWVCNADGSDPVQLTFFGGHLLAGSPRWSPDGKLITFESRVAGEANLYVIDPAGGAPRKLNIDIHGNTLASWSGDGKWIYFVNGDDMSKSSVWKVPSEGGHAVQVVKAPATYPLESPDGQYLYFSRNKRLWRVKTDGLAPEPVASIPEMTFLGDEWFPSGSGIYFIAHSNDNVLIEFLDLSTGKTRKIWEPQNPLPVWIGGMPVSKDGNWMLLPQIDQQSSDLMMIENWR